jgi:L-asparaginase
MASLPQIAVASLGGTITMTGAGGIRPRLQAADLVAAVPALANIARVRSATLATVPGASLTFGDLDSAMRWAGAEVDRGAQGIVLSQGTDTIEETAYYAHLHWNSPAPFVITGAMRAPGSVSSDGPANLLAAVTTAAAPEARERGALVVLDETIHAAERVRKEHTTALSAFRSTLGPAGTLREGVAEFFNPPERATPLPPPTRLGTRVAAIGTGIGDDGRLIALAEQDGVDGIVIAAFGAGHLPAAVAHQVERAARRIPVVVASRVGAGSTLRATYGFEGSEQDLARRGALLAGRLDPWKARVLLWSVLAAELEPATFQQRC